MRGNDTNWIQSYFYSSLLWEHEQIWCSWMPPNLQIACWQCVLKVERLHAQSAGLKWWGSNWESICSIVLNKFTRIYHYVLSVKLNLVKLTDDKSRYEFSIYVKLFCTRKWITSLLVFNLCEIGLAKEKSKIILKKLWKIVISLRVSTSERGQDLGVIGN